MIKKLNEHQEELDPEIIKIRDKIISKIGNKPLDEVNEIIKKLLNDQMDENTRLAVLAARLKIIRQKIHKLYENKSSFKETKPKVPQKLNLELESKQTEQPKEIWMRIKLLEACEIEGKSIDKDVILDVKKADGEKLVLSKKAQEVKDENLEQKESKNKKDISIQEDTKKISANNESMNEDKEKSAEKKDLKENVSDKKQDDNSEEKKNLTKSDPNLETKQEFKIDTKDYQEKTISENVVTDEKTQGENETKKDLLKQHEEKDTQENVEKE